MEFWQKHYNVLKQTDKKRLFQNKKLYFDDNAAYGGDPNTIPSSHVVYKDLVSVDQIIWYLKKLLQTIQRLCLVDVVIWFIGLILSLSYIHRWSSSRSLARTISVDGPWSRQTTSRMLRGRSSANRAWYPRKVWQRKWSEIQSRPTRWDQILPLNLPNRSYKISTSF